MKRTDIDPAVAGQLAEILHQRGPLAGLPVKDLARFAGSGALVEVAPGETLIREGDAPVEFYLLLEGALAVRAQDLLLARIERPGEVVGEAAVLLSSKRTADVVAESAVRAVAIPGELLVLSEFRDIATGIRSSMLRDDWVEY